MNTLSNGAEYQNRTGMVLQPADFKSAAYTYFANPALNFKKLQRVLWSF